jgi:hypothetical protein
MRTENFWASGNLSLSFSFIYQICYQTSSTPYFSDRQEVVWGREIELKQGIALPKEAQIIKLPSTLFRF